MILTRDRDLIVVSLFFADFRTQVTKEKYILVLLARRKKDAMSNISLKITASHDILELAVMRRMYEMAKKQEYLKQHRFKVYQGKDGRWFTYVPDPRKETGRRQVVRHTREELDDAIVAAYKDIEDNPTIREVYEEWQERRLYLNKICEATVTRENQTFDHLFKDLENKKIRSLMPEDYISFLEEQIPKHNLTRKAFNNLKGIVKGILKRAKKRKLIYFSIDSVFSDLDVTEMDFKPQIIDDCKEIFYEDEFSKIMRYCYDHRDNIYSLAVALMFVSGLRVGEVVSLKHSDILDDVVYVHRTETKYSKDGHIHIEVKEYPKTPAGVRHVIIPKSYVWVLQGMSLMSPSRDFIFVGKNGNRIRTEAIRKKMKRICHKLDIPQKSPHKARKTYGSILIDNRVDSKLVEKQMGHTNIACTEHYYHRDRKRDQDKRKIINSIPEFKAL